MTARHSIKQSLSRMIERVGDGFVALLRSRPGHWFRRGPIARFFDFVIIQSSKKYLCFEVDIAISIFPLWDRQYYRHQLRAATGLPNVRIGSGTINMDDVPYKHDGTTQGVAKALARIEGDLQNFGQPWLDRFRHDAALDQLLQFGLSWIESHQEAIPPNIIAQLQDDFTVAEFRNHRVENQLLQVLKRDLRVYADQIGASKWHRQQTAILAIDLLHHAGGKT